MNLGDRDSLHDQLYRTCYWTRTQEYVWNYHAKRQRKPMSNKFHESPITAASGAGFAVPASSLCFLSFQPQFLRTSLRPHSGLLWDPQLSFESQRQWEAEGVRCLSLPATHKRTSSHPHIHTLLLICVWWPGILSFSPLFTSKASQS